MHPHPACVLTMSNGSEPVFTTRMSQLTLPFCSRNTPKLWVRSSHVASGCADAVTVANRANIYRKRFTVYFLGMTLPSMCNVVERSRPLVLIFTDFLKAPGRPMGL